MDIGDLIDIHSILLPSINKYGTAAGKINSSSRSVYDTRTHRIDLYPTEQVWQNITGK